MYMECIFDLDQDLSLGLGSVISLKQLTLLMHIGGKLRDAFGWARPRNYLLQRPAPRKTMWILQWKR